MFYAKRVGLIYHILSALLMGFAPLLNKYALQTISPLLALFISSVCVSFFAFLMKGSKTYNLSGLLTLPVATIGLLNFLATLIMFYGLDKLEASTVVLINRFYIVFCLLLSIYIAGEQPKKHEYFCIFFLFLGCICLTFNGFHFYDYLFIAISLLSPLLFSISNLYAKFYAKSIGNGHLIFQTNVISIIFALLLIVITRQEHITFSLDSIFFLAIAALIGGFFGVSLFYKGLQNADFYVAGIVRTFVPLFTLFYATIFHIDIHYSALNYLGAMLMILAALILALKQKHSKTAD